MALIARKCCLIPYFQNSTRPAIFNLSIQSFNVFLDSKRKKKIYKNSNILHRESYIPRLISLAFLTNKWLTVTTLLKNVNLGSVPTIQRYIRKLVEKKLLSYGDNQDDRRLNYPLPAQKAIELLIQLCQVRVANPEGVAR